LTMNTYGHVVASVQREAASKRDAILGGVAVNEQKLLFGMVSAEGIEPSTYLIKRRN
jgi:hypothetical protein